MPKKRATSYDVALLAGVSQSAVSRVFSLDGSASEKTREKVIKAAEHLGFAPNPIAKSLSLGRSRLAGLVVTQYTQKNYPVALKSAVDVMTETGDSLLIQITESSDVGVDASNIGDESVRQLLRKHVDIIICAASIGIEVAQLCERSGVPLVLINRNLDFRGVDLVQSPNAAIMHEIAGLLAASGVRQSIFLGGGDGNWISVERRQGYFEACKAMSLPIPIIIEGHFDYESGQEAILALGMDINKIDAIVSANDAMALGAMDVLRYDMGLSVPSDIQVVGHDNIEAARYQAYSLTSVRQDMHLMLSVGIQLAYARLKDPTRDSAKIVIPNALIQRKSTKTAFT